MLTFLFWNINQKPLPETVLQMVEEYQVDVLLLAESRLKPEDLSPLQYCAKRVKIDVAMPRERVQIFTQQDSKYITEVEEGPRHTIRMVRLPDRDEIILVGVHLGDKQNNNRESQYMEIPEIIKEIRGRETIEQHRRTVVLGDFNMNPYETGMVSARGFHATMTRQKAMSNEQ
jgi:exonuclease III